MARLSLKKDDIVIYESTVYPGATEEVCVPILERQSDLKFNQDRFNVLINEVPDFKTESEKNLLLLTQAEQRIRENQVTVNTLENDSVMIKNQIEALERNITTINHDINLLNVKPDLVENIDLSLDDLKKSLMLKQNSFEFLISKEKYLDETLSNNKDLYLKSEDLKFLEFDK